MPPKKRPRPSLSFSPPVGADAPATTGWVYRSDESPTPPPTAVARSAAETAPATRAAVPAEKPTGRPRWASVLRALTVPFTLIIVTSMPAAQAFSRRRSSWPTWGA
jgi:hypothetical protein